MRIPPAVASEIGSMYAAASANADVAVRMEASAARIDGSRGAAVEGHLPEAVRGVREAAQMLASMPLDGSVAADARRGAQLAAGHLRTTLSALEQGAATTALEQLAAASAAASSGARAAALRADLHRLGASELARQYM